MSQMKAGAILSYLSIFISVLIAFLYTPVIIRLLGQAEYGLYALIGSVSAYFSILDLGLGNAIVRYTSRNRAIGDKTSESKLNGLFLILYSFIGFLTIIVGLFVHYNIENIFGGSFSIEELSKAKIMVVILIINFALSFPLSIFGSIIQAYERFVVFKSVEIIRSMMIPIITVPILFLGHGSVAMVLITTLVNISALFFNLFYCFKKLDLKFHFGKIDFSLLKEIIGYSFFVFLGVVVDQVYWNTDQFILGIVAGTVPVAIYAIGMQFKTLYMRFSTAISGLFLPKASIMVANKATGEDLTRSLIKYGRLQYIVLSYILSGFVLFGQQFINVWAGTDYSYAYYIALIVMIPLTIPLTQNFGLSVLYAKNLQGFRSIVLIFIAVLNILLTIPSAKAYGGIGAASVTAISLILGNVLIMNIYYQYKIGMNMLLFWRNIIIMSIPVVITIFLAFIMQYFLPKNNLIVYCIEVLLFSIVFLVLMWKMALNKYEKDFFLSFYSKIRNKIFKH